MARPRILFLSAITADEHGERHSDITDLLRKRGVVERQKTSGSYAIVPGSDHPGAVEVAGRRRDETPTTFIAGKLERRVSRIRQAQAEIRTRAVQLVRQVNEVDCVVAEVTVPCVQLGILIGRAAARGIPVLCLRRAVMQLPLLPIVEDDPRITLCDVATQAELYDALETFFLRVTHRVVAK